MIIPYRYGPPAYVLLVSDPTTAWIAKRILDARSELGWTQSALAERLNRTQTAVSYWESARRKRAWTTPLHLARRWPRRRSSSSLSRTEPGPRPDRVAHAPCRRRRGRRPEPARRAPGPAQPAAGEINVGARQPAYAANELLERAGDHRASGACRRARRALWRTSGPRLHFPDALSGLVIEAEDGAIIAVNRNHVETRQRFSIAHELGHHLLGHTDRFHLDLTDGAAGAIDYRAERVQRFRRRPPHAPPLSHQGV